MKYRILAIHQGRRDDPGPCELYRVTTPLAYLSKRPLWDCKWMPFSMFHENYLGEKAEQGVKILASQYDLIVWARTSLRGNERAFNDAAWTVNRFRELGVKQVYEIDDDYTEENRIVLNGGDAMQFATWCDAITVTTPYLAKTMNERTKRPVYVLPNMLDPMFWGIPPQFTMPEGTLRITLSGSPTHTEDWRVLTGALHRIAADFPYVRFIIGGHHPDYLKGIPNAEYLPPIPYVNYIDLIKNSDIILCPVTPFDKFNLGKSPIKATEGQGATRLVNGEPMGAAVIATDNPVYRLAIPDNNVQGVLVEQTTVAWENAMRELIQNTGKRRELQRQGYKYVNRKFNLDNGWMEWSKVYQTVLKKSSNPLKIDHEKSYSSYRESPRFANDYSR